MNIAELKQQFKNGVIDKATYIQAMLARHNTLFEYADFIRDTDIEAIEISDDGVIFKLRGMPYSMACPVSQARVAPIEILNFDRYEPAEIAVLKPLLESCRTILDVGANIGWFSLWFAQQRPAAQIHAFEPLPDNYRFLVRNINTNQLSERITAYQYGLSDQVGTFDFYSYPTGSTNASMVNVSGAGNAVSVMIPTMTLDEWVLDMGTVPDFIKCDVEGAEWLVFQGGQATLTRHRPIVFTEMLRKWSKPFGYHPNDVISLFERLGYYCYAINLSGLTRFSQMTDESTETNFVFLHNEKHAALVRYFQG